MNKSGSKTFPVLNPLCRVPHFFVFIQNTRDLCFLQQKDFFRFYKINIRGSTIYKMWYLSGVILFIHSRPGTKGKTGGSPWLPSPRPDQWSYGTNHSTPKSGFNLILPPGSKQIPKTLPIKHKRGLGLVRHPLADYRKKRNPRLSPVTESANRSRVCTKRAEPWGCPDAQQNKTIKEQKRCPPPLFRPGHRLKHRSKAIKIWEPQKNTARFSFFMYTQNHDFARDKTGL